MTEAAGGFVDCILIMLAPNDSRGLAADYGPLAEMQDLNFAKRSFSQAPFNQVPRLPDLRSDVARQRRGGFADGGLGCDLQSRLQLTDIVRRLHERYRKGMA